MNIVTGGQQGLHIRKLTWSLYNDIPETCRFLIQEIGLDVIYF